MEDDDEPIDVQLTTKGELAAAYWDAMDSEASKSDH